MRDARAADPNPMGQFALATYGDAPLDAATVTNAIDAALHRARIAATPAEAVDAVVAALDEKLVGAHVACFVLEHERLWLLACRGYTLLPEGVPITTGVIGRSARDATPQVVNDVEADPDFVHTRSGTVAQVAVPLTADGDVIGVLSIEADSAIAPDCVDAFARLAAVLSPAVADLRNVRTLDVSSLARLFVHLTSLRDPDQVARAVAVSLGRVLPVDCAFVYLTGDDGRPVEYGAFHAGEGGEAECLPAAAVDALRARVDRTAVVELLTLQGVRIPELIGSRAHSVVLLPLRIGDRELGTLVGVSAGPIVFEQQQAELAALLATHGAAALDAVLAIDRERTSALTDSLTGLLNRRGFEARLESAFTEAHGERRPLSLAVLDCDDFKQLNDRAGHAFGDAMLRSLGAVLTRELPPGATAARFGGDEFVVMLPGVDIDDAGTVLAATIDRLRHGLDVEGFPTGVSAGVATYPYDGPNAAQLLRAADQALYEAKDRGKACVVASREIARHDTSVTTAKQTRMRGESTLVLEAAEAADALWRETDPEALLDRLARSLAYVVGGTAVMISRLDGDRLIDHASHALRDVDIEPDNAYLVGDFPVTARVLETRRSRSVSFHDPDLDPAEAFAMRDLGMNACILLPLVVEGVSWGLVEVYDMRIRSYTPAEQAVADLLVLQAGRKLELIGGAPATSRRRPLRRPPGASRRVR